MIFAEVLADVDRKRIEQSLNKLTRHDISRWALTGGFAIEQHINWRGGAPSLRSLHDIDFIVSSFQHIPDSLGREFLLRHVHPDDPPGKSLLQFVDPDTSLRLDVFRAYGSVMDRTFEADLGFGLYRTISLQDLTARAARLSWDLSGDATVAPKHVRDFVRLLEVANSVDVEAVWQEHRNRNSPERFSDAIIDLGRLIEERAKQLVLPTYSMDVTAICERCRETGEFRLADANRILAILGYC
jgi:hypothetical protein